MAYTALDVKNLRERTGAGMMDCKKALDETDGNIEAAIDALRAKGLAAAAKKFAVYHAKVEGSQPDAYLMSHSQQPYLMAPDGTPISILPADQPKTDANEGAPALVASELAKWVR